MVEHGTGKHWWIVLFFAAAIALNLVFSAKTPHRYPDDDNVCSYSSRC